MQQTNSLRIFSIISQIEETLEASPKAGKFGGNGNRRAVDIELIFDLLGDLKVTIPEDIRRANSVLIEADTLLEHASEEAEEMVTQAQMEAEAIHQLAVAASEEMSIAAEQEYEARVAEHEILKEAQRRAELLQQHAEHNANIVYAGAKQYADELLQDVQRYLLQYHQLVAQNRSELGVAEEPLPQTQAEPAPSVPQQPVQPSAPQQPQPRRAVAQPGQPNPPQTAPVMQDEEEEEYEPAPKKRWSLFGKRSKAKDEYEDEEYYEDDFDDAYEDEEEDLYEPAPKRGKRVGRKKKNEEMDLDLDE